MKKVVLLLLLTFLHAYSYPYSDIRLEIISKIKKLEEEKQKIKDKKRIEKINEKIKKLKQKLELYENNSSISG